MKPLVRGEETDLVEIPANWYLDDLPPMMFIKTSPELHGFVNPRQSKRCGATSSTGCTARMDYGVFTMTIHPDVSGRPQVLLMLERLIEHINGHEGVRWATVRRDRRRLPRPQPQVLNRPAAPPPRSTRLLRPAGRPQPAPRPHTPGVTHVRQPHLRPGGAADPALPAATPLVSAAWARTASASRDPQGHRHRLARLDLRRLRLHPLRHPAARHPGGLRLVQRHGRRGVHRDLRRYRPRRLRRRPTGRPARPPQGHAHHRLRHRASRPRPSAATVGAAYLVGVRSIGGLGLAEQGVNTTYLNEIYALSEDEKITKRRGFIYSIVQGGWPLGTLLAAAFAAAFLPLVGWRGCFLIATFPALLVILVRRTLKETPQFVLQDRVRKLLKEGRATEAQAWPPSTAWRLREGAPLREVFAPESRRNTIFLGLAWFTNWFGIQTFSVLGTSVLTKGKGVDFAGALIMFIIINLVGFTGYLFHGWAGDRFGRRNVIAFGWLISGVLFAAMLLFAQRDRRGRRPVLASACSSSSARTQRCCSTWARRTPPTAAPPARR